MDSRGIGSATSANNQINFSRAAAARLVFTTANKQLKGRPKGQVRLITHYWFESVGSRMGFATWKAQTSN
jgi:hypothetical protein